MTEIESFCARCGVTVPFERESLRTGRNSEVWRLFNSQGQWLLKHYFQSPTDKRQRLLVEFNFLRFLEQSATPGVARPLGLDTQAQWGLFSFLPGVRPRVIEDRHIEQAVRFLVKINAKRDSLEAQALPAAADACLRPRDHLELVAKRFQRWIEFQPENPFAVAAQKFVRERLWPCWEKLSGSATARIEANEAQYTAPYLILSPSDFGFHNTLEHEGQLFFVDFEYAGWDDPAKLICDFLCQPELPVSEAQGELFLARMREHLASEPGLELRVREFLPWHRLKWCCLLLNEFLGDGWQRRLHAGLQAEGLLKQQLEKTQNYFEQHLSFLS